MVNNMPAERASLRVRTRKWFTDLKAEFRKIVWPDRKTLIKEVVAVIAASVALGILIAVLDFIFQFGIDWILSLFY